jgi:hypothetical protein
VKCFSLACDQEERRNKVKEKHIFALGWTSLKTKSFLASQILQSMPKDIGVVVSFSEIS